MGELAVDVRIPDPTYKHHNRGAAKMFRAGSSVRSSH